MQLNELIELFTAKPYCLDMGKGSLSKWLKCSIEDVKKAKKIIRAKLKNTKHHPKNGLPKILIFDIETSPMVSYHWGHWQQNIYLDQVIQNPIMLTWAAKWLFDSETMSDSISVKEVLKLDDKRLVTNLWKLCDEADIIVAHYGDKFDIPMMNVRFITHGLPPISTTKSIDTKSVASKHFRFPSNKLDALGGYFGLGQKIKTDFLLWRGCMEGDLEKIEEMRTYNVQDVVLLEEVYLKLRPYIKSHPNVGLYMETEKAVCGNCGSSELIEDGKFYYTMTGKYKTLRCGCGAISRYRVSSVSKDKRKNMVVSVAGR
jgi:RNase P subunit RPR2